VVVHYAVLKRLFPRKTIRDLLLTEVFYYSIFWSKTKNIGKAIKPVESLTEAFRNMSTSPFKGKLISLSDHDTKKTFPARKVSAPRKVKNRPAPELSLEKDVQLDVVRMRRGLKAIQQWGKHADNGWSGPHPTSVYFPEVLELRKRAKRKATREGRSGKQLLVNTLKNQEQKFKELLKAVNKNGFLQQRVKESEFGRWYNQGLNLQTSKKSIIREAALYGCYEFDFGTCHYTILRQIAQDANEKGDLNSNGKPFSYKYISDHVEHKERDREALVNYLNLDWAEDAKELFAGLAGGASMSGNPYSSLSRILSPDEIESLVKYNRFRNLYSEVREIHRYMLSTQYAPICPHNKTITNAAGLHIESHRPFTERLAFHLQGKEAVMLLAMLKSCTVGQSKPLLATHDGCVTRDDVDIPDIVSAVKNVTGVTAKVNQNQFLPSGLE
jgi:hypothetical protein